MEGRLPALGLKDFSEFFLGALLQHQHALVPGLADPGHEFGQLHRLLQEIASTPLCTEPWPVSMMISVSGLIALIRLSVSSPSMPGMLRSTTMASYSSSFASLTACSPLVTALTFSPRSSSRLDSVSRKSCSSSTKSTLASISLSISAPLFLFAGPVAGPLPVARSRRLLPSSGGVSKFRASRGPLFFLQLSSWVASKQLLPAPSPEQRNTTKHPDVKKLFLFV